MSDFDKEAEREKLRKKYERDQADREATQRMSDLLLKGARMTNTHCDTCGDPLFEQNDVTFCPTCHGGPGGVEASLDEAGPTESGSADGADTSSGSAEKPAASADTSVPADASAPTESATGSESDVDDGALESRDTGSANERRSPPNEQARSRQPTDSAEVDTSSEVRSTPARDARARDRSRAGGGDLEPARDALVESLEYFAGEAAQTDDPRYAKECLEAAHEAADTLAALR